MPKVLAFYEENIIITNSCCKYLILHYHTVRIHRRMNCCVVLSKISGSIFR